MAGFGRRKWVSGQGKWRVQWVDNNTFKVEQEADGLTDEIMEQWGSWMDQQLEKRFGSEPRPKLVASSLNFSRNELGDEGIRCICDYVRSRDISVQMVKFFKNSIGDSGAWAIGQLMASSPDPVHEVHLSHNRISEQGACSIFEAIARSRRYPYSSERPQRRDQRGLTPVWLRMEYNCINWTSIRPRLDQQQVRWCAAESRDGWHPKDTAPMVCMHHSYCHQKIDQAGPNSLGHGAAQWSSDNSASWHQSDTYHNHRQGENHHSQHYQQQQWASSSSRGGGGGGGDGGHGGSGHQPMDGSAILAALQGDGRAKKNLEAQLAHAPPMPRDGEAPGYHEGYHDNYNSGQQRDNAGREQSQGKQVAARSPQRQSEGSAGSEEEVPMYVFLDASAVRQMLVRDDGIFTFQGLLNLCQQGHAKCIPPEGNQMPPWIVPSEERERIIFMVTDSVLDELEELAAKHPTERRRIQWLRNAPDSYLQVCHAWGLIEILETKLHTSLMKLTATQEHKAREMRVSARTHKIIDFACLWESQIESNGRVVFVTADENVRRFGVDVIGGCLRVIHADELNRRFSQDRQHGAHWLCRAARLKPKDCHDYCGAVLSASLMAILLAAPQASPASAPQPWNGSALEASTTNEDEVVATSGDAELDRLRQELGEAMAVLGEASQQLGAHSSYANGSASEFGHCVEKIDEARERWRSLLALGPVSQGRDWETSEELAIPASACQ